jgi:BirA family biotin operon repressor/biotin-[acetyl-CoA-carboxylase] ligase
MQDSLRPAVVHEALDTIWLGRTYRYLPSTSSTNDLLKQQEIMGDVSANPPGTVLLTDFQERGRGRMARSWIAPPGSSLLFSILLRPRWPAERISWLTMISGLAVSEAVEQQCGLSARLKWPNDCVVKQDDSSHKYCGILIEGGFSGAELLDYAVVGIGVNVNIQKDQLPHTQFPATSLQIANGRTLSRLELFCAILSCFERHYELADQGTSPHANWQNRLIYMNQRVKVSSRKQNFDINGLAIGTDPAGRLKIQGDDGEIHLIAAGDVTLRPD